MTGFTAMDAQTQDALSVSEKEQLTAPPGWTKKLVPASAKSITLRKYDVVFIAPDGQEVKSKWHLNRYLKAHPEGPASSEFIWSSGEEAPMRRSTRFATKEVNEDNKTTSRQKGKRNAPEMEAEEMDHDQEKAPSRKRAKKADKSAGSDEKNAVEDAANVMENDEVMHEAIACDNEATQAAALGDVQKDKYNDENLVEVEANKETVTEKSTDEGLNKQVKAEKATGSNAAIGGECEDIQVKDEGLDNQGEAEKATVSSAIIGGEHEEMQVKVIEVKESLTDDGLHAAQETESKAAQETDTLVVSAEELKVEEIAMETKEMELKEHLDQQFEENDDLKVEEIAMETKVMELKEHLDQKFEENDDVSCKVTMMTSVVEELTEGNDKCLESSMKKETPFESPTQKEDSVEPLMQKEEQERLTHIQTSPLEVEHIKDKSPSEFSSSPVTVTVANQ